jgi:hypothetical protein
MYKCPHCGQPGISFVAKWWSCSTAPARCASCKLLSYVRDTVANAIFAGEVFSLVLTIVAGLVAGSWLLALFLLAISIAFYGAFWHVARLRATTQQQVVSARNLNWGVLIVAVLINLVS